MPDSFVFPSSSRKAPPGPRCGTDPQLPRRSGHQGKRQPVGHRSHADKTPWRVASRGPSSTIRPNTNDSSETTARRRSCADNSAATSDAILARRRHRRHRHRPRPRWSEEKPNCRSWGGASRSKEERIDGAQRPDARPPPTARAIGAGPHPANAMTPSPFPVERDRRRCGFEYAGGTSAGRLARRGKESFVRQSSVRADSPGPRCKGVERAFGAANRRWSSCFRQPASANLSTALFEYPIFVNTPDGRRGECWPRQQAGPPPAPPTHEHLQENTGDSAYNVPRHSAALPIALLPDGRGPCLRFASGT